MPELPKLTSLHVSCIDTSVVPDLPTTMTYDQLTIRARPETDLWRQPPNTDIDNAPTLLISTPIKMDRFHSARVTVSGNWSTPYDQGGLVLFIPDEGAMKWVKTAIEYADEKPYVEIVGTIRWSDWSSVPLKEEEGGEVTIQVEREMVNGEKMESLWVYIVDKSGEKMGLVRRINWWFTPDQKATTDSEKDRVLLIGGYAARPRVPAGEGREKEELVVKLGFEVKLFDN